MTMLKCPPREEPQLHHRNTRPMYWHGLPVSAPLGPPSPCDGAPSPLSITPQNPPFPFPQGYTALENTPMSSLHVPGNKTPVAQHLPSLPSRGESFVTHQVDRFWLFSGNSWPTSGSPREEELRTFLFRAHWALSLPPGLGNDHLGARRKCFYKLAPAREKRTSPSFAQFLCKQSVALQCAPERKKLPCCSFFNLAVLLRSVKPSSVTE